MKEVLKSLAYFLMCFYFALAIFGKGIIEGKKACINDPESCVKEFGTPEGDPVNGGPVL